MSTESVGCGAVAGQVPGDRTVRPSSADRLERELRRMVLLHRRALQVRRRGQVRRQAGITGISDP